MAGDSGEDSVIPPYRQTKLLCRHRFLGGKAGGFLRSHRKGQECRPDTRHSQSYSLSGWPVLRKVLIKENINFSVNALSREKDISFYKTKIIFSFKHI